MTTRTRVLLAVLIGALALGACTSPTPTPPLSVTPSAVSSASPIPTPDLSGTRKDAADTVVKYRALIDELRQQYKPDVSRLATLARGKAYEKWSFTLQDDFVNGYHQTGTTSVVVLETGSGPLAYQWLITACLDMTRADIVDKNGKTTLTERPGKKTVIYTVEEDTKLAQWFVMAEEVTTAC